METFKEKILQKILQIVLICGLNDKPAFCVAFQQETFPCYFMFLGGFKKGNCGIVFFLAHSGNGEDSRKKERKGDAISIMCCS